MYVTFINFGYFDVVPHDHDYTQFFGQNAMAAYDAYFAERVTS